MSLMSENPLIFRLVNGIAAVTLFGTISAPNDRMLQLLQAFCRSRPPRSRILEPQWRRQGLRVGAGWCVGLVPLQKICVCVEMVQSGALGIVLSVHRK